MTTKATKDHQVAVVVEPEDSSSHGSSATFSNRIKNIEKAVELGNKLMQQTKAQGELGSEFVSMTEKMKETSLLGPNPHPSEIRMRDKVSHAAIDFTLEYMKIWRGVNRIQFAMILEAYQQDLPEDSDPISIEFDD